MFYQLLPMKAKIGCDSESKSKVGNTKTLDNSFLHSGNLFMKLVYYQCVILVNKLFSVKLIIVN